jgi:hypothetical protein
MYLQEAQLTTKELTPTLIELEIAKLARLNREKDGYTNDYHPSIAIDFADFLTLLNLLSAKVLIDITLTHASSIWFNGWYKYVERQVYPKDAAIHPEIAVRRLLLENVLLLSNRRLPLAPSLDTKNPESIQVVRGNSIFTRIRTDTICTNSLHIYMHTHLDIFGTQLRGIFTYYSSKADKRRNQAVAAEAARIHKIIADNMVRASDESSLFVEMTDPVGAFPTKSLIVSHICRRGPRRQTRRRAVTLRPRVC